MPQLVEPTTPDAQREIIRQSSGRNRHRSRNRSARSALRFPGLSDRAELRGITRNDRHVRSIRPTKTGHMLQPSFVASSGNDWVTFDCADGHYTARWRMRRWVLPM